MFTTWDRLATLSFMGLALFLDRPGVGPAARSPVVRLEHRLVARAIMFVIVGHKGGHNEQPQRSVAANTLLVIRR